MVKNVAVLRMAMTRLSGTSDPLPGVASPRCRAKVPSGRWLGRAVLGRAVLGRADGWAGLCWAGPMVGPGWWLGRARRAAGPAARPRRWSTRADGRSAVPGRAGSKALRDGWRLRAARDEEDRHE